MKNRYLPFGYEIADGKIITVTEQASAVQRIFETYIEGKSLQQIAKQLTAENVSYREDEPCWNKNMVSRILMNSVYRGTERYPRIVSDKQFGLAAQTRESKSVTYSPVLKYFRKEMQCGGCGARLYWHTKSNQWFCRQCGMWSKPIQAEQLSNFIVEKLEWLRQNTGQLRAAENIGNLQSIELGRLNREIRLADEESDVDEIILKIIHRAELQYEFCSAENADPETMRIRNACIRHAGPSGDFPDKFYNETVSKVILYRDAHIEIKLQNGQVI